MPRTRPGRRRLAATLVALLAVGCGVLELGGSVHEAVTLEDATLGTGQLVVPVELLATEIAGSTVVTLRVAVDEVACAEDRGRLPEVIALGSPLRFVQEGDVLDSEPPEVSGVEVEVACD